MNARWLIRRTAKSGIEYVESAGGVPGDVVGGGSDGLGAIGSEAMDREGGVVQRCQAGRQAGPSRVVTIFVPPAVLQEVQAVFQSPMLADVLQQFRRGDAIRIEAGNEVTHVMREHDAVAGMNDAVDAQR